MPSTGALDCKRAEIRDHTGTLRRWQAGRISGLPQDHYDSLVLAACTAAWLPAGRVVGAAMAHCPPRNGLSDLLFSSRLQHLIGAGIVQADGPQRALQGYRVRRAHEH